MLNEELEQGLRDRLYDMEEAVNTDATWLAVQAGLQPPKKKRRGIIWWWLSGGFMLLALGSWLLWPSGDSDHPGLLAEKVMEANAEAPAAEDTQIVDQTEAIATDNQESKLYQGLEPPVQPEGRPAPTVVANRGLVNEMEDRSAVGPTLALPAVAPALRRPKKAAPEVIAVPQEKAKFTKAGKAKKGEMISSTEASISSQSGAISSVATLPITLLPVENTFPQFPPIKEVSDFRSIGKSGWTLGASGGIAQVYRTVATTFTRDSFDQRGRDLTNERVLEAVTADLLVGYQTTKGWTMRSGLSYQRVNSVVEARLESTVELRREGIAEIIINPGGDTSFVTGLINESVRTRSYNRYYNQLTTIDFPLLLGKTFSKGRWRIGLEAGPVFNLVTSGSARYQLADGSFSTRAENDLLFRKRLSGISWRTNVSAGLLIMPGLEANIGLSALRRGRSGFEVEGSSTRTVYDLVGVRVGVRRAF